MGTITANKIHIKVGIGNRSRRYQGIGNHISDHFTKRTEKSFQRSETVQEDKSYQAKRKKKEKKMIMITNFIQNYFKKKSEKQNNILTDNEKVSERYAHRLD